MIDHIYRVFLRTGAIQHVIASTVQIHGDHLVFLNSRGVLTALFLLDIVHTWGSVTKRDGYIGKTETAERSDEWSPHLSPSGTDSIQ